MRIVSGCAVMLLLICVWVSVPGALAASPSPDDGKPTGTLLPGDGECRLLQFAEGSGASGPGKSERVFLVASAADEALVASAEDASDAEPLEDDAFDETADYVVSDPLEPLNRAFFTFNDRLYFWVFKPLAQGYRAVVPEQARVGVSNFFTNLKFPIRFVNCILQGKGEEAGYEFVSFFMNSTVGLAGFLDVSGKGMGLEPFDEDLGQTLGFYGMGPHIYLHWPILGPSSLRDTVGMLGDSFLDPVNYLVPETKYNIGVKSYNQVNKTSLTIGTYEDLKKSALDPYVAMRDAYFQYRKREIEE